MNSTDTQIRAAAQRLEELERTLGPQHQKVAEALFEYAQILKRNKTRLLDAANMIAKAEAIHNGVKVESSSDLYAGIVTSPQGVDVDTDPIPRNETNQKKCVQCAELIKIEANKCRFCGSAVKPVLTTLSSNSAIGLLICILGLSSALWLAFVYDVTVATDGGRMANLDGMTCRLNLVLISCTIAMIGAVVYGANLKRM